MKLAKLFLPVCTVIGIACSLYLLTKFFIGLHSYSRLQSSAPISVARWNIKKKSDSDFRISVKYLFESRGSLYENEYQLESLYFLNLPSAKTYLSNIESRGWVCWFDPQNPSRSALEKQYPLSLMIRAFGSVLITIYLLLLINKHYKKLEF